MNLGISQRLLVLGGTAVAALLLVLGSSYLAAHAARHGMEVLGTTTLPSAQLIASIERDTLTMRRIVAVHSLELYDTKKREYEAALDAARKHIDVSLTEYEAKAVDTEERALVAKLREQVQAYDGFVGEVVKKSNDFDLDGARELISGTGVGLGTAMTNALEELRKYNDNYGLQTQKDAEASATRLASIAFGIGALAVLIVALMAWLLMRSIRQSLNAVQDAVEYIERNSDFTRRVEVRSQDELGAIGKAFNRLVGRMHESLQGFSHSARMLASSASEMASSSTLLAEATARQSEAASTMAATVEEMTVSINHVADRAQDANDASSNSGQLAAKGERVISQTVSDINEIASSVGAASGRIKELDEHSGRIASVVAVIKEVADQTNLLALNAAIEAARAGEQGRGFAVVADEVRKLAERTALSTTEISASINAMRASAAAAVAGMDDAVRQVATGVSGAEQTSAAIHEIGQGVVQTVEQVGDIAHAIREQGNATHAIAAQVETIAQISEENSAVAHQSASAATTLDRLAREMNEAVAAYRI